MEKNNDIRHGRHCVFRMHVHLVFVTKYRRGVFTAEITGDLSTKGICIQTGKQSQGCFKPNDPEEKVRDT